MVTLVETISESKVNGSRLGRGFGCWSAALRDCCCFLPPSGDCSPAGAQRMVQNLYQGMLQDPVTGLYYERNRNDSPSLGTWISQYPLQYINGASTYRLVMGNPVGGTDPSGLSPAHCECGPEIGALLEKIRTTVIQKFLGYTRAQQSKFLRDFFWPSNAVADWDITGLADKRVTGTAGNRLCHGVATVEVLGRCYRQQDVNYWLYGVVNRLLSMEMNGNLNPANFNPGIMTPLQINADWEALNAMDTRIFLYRVWYAWNYGGARNAHVREVWAVAGFENDLSMPASTAGKGCGKSTDRPNKPLAGGAGVGPLRINFSVGP